jgi:membrane protein YdbS with pleckstrin-like domain
MATDKEKEFMHFWEQHRQAQSSLASKLFRGLPMAVLFALPVLLLVVVVWLFIPDWYIKISKTSPGAFIIVVIALLLVVVFYSVFRMHYKWEMNEQLYNELKAKENKAARAVETVNKNQT